MINTSDEWYKDASEIIQDYKRVADSHWSSVAKNGTANDPYHASAFEDRSIDHYTQDKKSQRKLFNLLSVFSRQPNVDIRHATNSVSNIEIEMYHKLGFWLCSYFLGVPRLDAWDTVSSLANQLGAYPGGAFYDKLAGDVYRYERRQAAKRPGIARDPLYVMAFTPLLLLPDEDDLIFIPQEVKASMSDAMAQYRNEVEKLACRYLRYQAWRYLKNEPVLPIYYAVSRTAVSEAFYALARKKARIDEINATTEQQQMMISNEKLMLMHKSDEWIARFLSSVPNSSQHLAVFTLEGTQRRGLTSCVLGEEDGVTANRPNRSGEATAFCIWTEGIVLKAERRKVMTLWEESVDSTKILLNPGGPASLAELWYDPTVERFKNGSLNGSLEVIDPGI